MLSRRALLGGGLAAAVSAVGAPRGAAAQRVVSDSAGRSVTLPARIDRVFAAGPPASILVYALTPDRLLGWPRDLRVEEQAYLPARYAGLPALGRLTGRGGTANIETVLAVKPDLILDYGLVTPTYASLADRVQSQTRVPYILLDGRLTTTPRVLRTAGAVLGAGSDGERLARQAEVMLADARRRVDSVPVARRPRVYYARGPKGLETGAAGSINTESLDFVGVRNVAEGVAPTGIATVSLEQVLAWNPDTIVTIDRRFATTVADDPTWRPVRAVREGRVFLAPLAPFPLIDFPPSVNRLIGLSWLVSVLYHEEFREDLRVCSPRWSARLSSSGSWPRPGDGR
ncbi:MAG: iron ABC transporter substrate-binding protein, partial [Candidatus Rokuibacteriota bacterium]